MNASDLNRIRSFASARARRAGLGREEAEDCAIEFVEHLLKTGPDELISTLGRPWSGAWLSRCAENWVQSTLRKRRNAEDRSVRLDGIADIYPAAVTNPTGGASDPTAAALRGELTVRLCDAAELLEAGQRELFRRRFLAEESIEEIAEATGRSRDAVRQALTAIRKRLRKLLAEAGMDEAEARAYVTCIAGCDAGR